MATVVVVVDADRACSAVRKGGCDSERGEAAQSVHGGRPVLKRVSVPLLGSSGVPL